MPSVPLSISYPFVSSEKYSNLRLVFHSSLQLTQLVIYTVLTVFCLQSRQTQDKGIGIGDVSRILTFLHCQICRSDSSADCPIFGTLDKVRDVGFFRPVIPRGQRMKYR